MDGDVHDIHEWIGCGRAFIAWAEYEFVSSMFIDDHSSVVRAFAFCLVAQSIDMFHSFIFFCFCLFVSLSFVCCT